MRDDPTLQILVEALRAYLIARPQAADTVRGIADWWLVGITPRPAVERITDALEILAVEELADKVVLPDGTEIWRAVPQVD